MDAPVIATPLISTPLISTPMTAREVARQVFRRTPAWFYRNRARLEVERGFPARGETGWDPVAIADWQARQRGAAGAGQATSPRAGAHADDAAALARNAARVAAHLGD
jgi:hypothetical protein